MKEKLAESKSVIRIIMDDPDKDLMDKISLSLLDDEHLTTNDVFAHALVLGICQLQDALGVKMSTKLAILSLKEDDVQEAIRKLKCEELVTLDEVDMIFYAAQNGHLEARIIMGDFKRFGRSIDRQ
jgi:hypothetical protein